METGKVNSLGSAGMGTNSRHCASTCFVRCCMSQHFVKISATLRLLTFPNLDNTVNEILGHGETNKTGARTMGGFCAQISAAEKKAKQKYFAKQKKQISFDFCFFNQKTTGVLCEATEFNRKNPVKEHQATRSK